MAKLQIIYGKMPLYQGKKRAKFVGLRLLLLFDS